jgi:hypothetical protein
MDRRRPRVDAGGATAWAEMRDAGGKRWRALVAALPVAAGEGFYLVRVVGASTEPTLRRGMGPLARPPARPSRSW